jgi:hypothetical protein
MSNAVLNALKTAINIKHIPPIYLLKKVYSIFYETAPTISYYASKVLSNDMVELCP